MEPQLALLRSEMVNPSPACPTASLRTTVHAPGGVSPAEDEQALISCCPHPLPRCKAPPLPCCKGFGRDT